MTDTATIAAQLSAERWHSATFSGWVVTSLKGFPIWLLGDDAEIEIPGLICADVTEKRMLLLDDGADHNESTVVAAVRTHLEKE